MNSNKIPPEAIQRYIVRRTSELKKLREAFELKETSEFYKVGYGLMGNAVNFGFPELEKLGEKLERAAKLSDWSLGQECIIELESWCLSEAKNSE